MIGLSATNHSLEVKLGGASVSVLDLTAAYKIITATDASVATGEASSNGVTPVTLVPAPSAGQTHMVEYLSVYNPNAASATVTVQTDAGGTKRVRCKIVLLQDETLEYMDGHGWRVIDSTGSIKSTSTAGYLTTAAAASTYLPLTGGTVGGVLVVEYASGAPLVIKGTGVTAYATFQRSGVAVGDWGSGDAIGSGTSADFGISSRSGAMAVSSNNGAYGIRIASTGGVTIATPASGHALDVQGISGSTAVTARAASGTAEIGLRTGVFGQTNNPRVDYKFTESTGAILVDYTGSASPTVSWGLAGTAFLSVDTSRSATVQQPTAGTALTVKARNAANAAALRLDNTDATKEVLQTFGLNGSTLAYMGLIGLAGQLISGTAQNDFAMRLDGGAFRLSTNGGFSTTFHVAAAGNVSIASPASGNGLSVSGPSANLNVEGGVALSGAANANLRYAISSGNGGCMVMCRGAGIDGVAFVYLYLVAVKVSGGGSPDVAQATVSQVGATGITFTFSNSGGNLNVAQSGANVNTCVVSFIS
jgi:hypothetical protein